MSAALHYFEFDTHFLSFCLEKKRTINTDLKNSEIIMSNEWPEDAPITNKEMLACAATLKKLYAGDRNYSFFESSNCRDLRKGIGPFARKYQAIMFEGKGRSEYEQKQFIKKSKLAQIAQKKDLDKIHLNNTKLRQQRIEMLSALTKSQDPSLPLLVPDGFVDEDVHSSSDGTDNIDNTATDNNATDNDATNNAIRLLAPNNGETKDDIKLTEPRACYVCKSRYTRLHHFYHSLCPKCSILNYEKRKQSCDLLNRVALVTGGRVKIGFCVALKLLRWGATVIVTTRFPTDCAKRYSVLKDYSNFKSRLHIYGLDFRDLKRIETFCACFEERHGRLDIIINNACQTIRRPAAYYAPLLQYETVQEGMKDAIHDVLQSNREFVQSTTSSYSSSASSLLLSNDSNNRVRNASSIDGGRKISATTIEPSTNTNVPIAPSVIQSQMVVHSDDADLMILKNSLPTNAVDVNGQQLDLRKRNTWIMKMEEIQTTEVAEVFAINSIAPFILNSQLTPLMKKSSVTTLNSIQRKFIVNVSAMEGKFYRIKSSYHPHTNMAKAALNMMTRTCADDLSKANIFMTAVDTGWINDENPVEKAAKYAETHNFQTPLDEIDAAARILDPIVDGLTDLQKAPKYGIFIKDYFETEW